MNTTPLESQEQKTLFEWTAIMTKQWPVLELLHAIPNGGSRNAIEARNLRLQGVRAGVPDIFLPCARKGYHGLYIELKRQKGGRVSVDQKKMILALNEQGYKAVVCYGWEEAANVILEYMT